MSLENDLSRIKDQLANCPHIENKDIKEIKLKLDSMEKKLEDVKNKRYYMSRPGLYIMVYLALSNSCDTYTKVKQLEQTQQRIERKLDVLPKVDYKNYPR